MPRILLVDDDGGVRTTLEGVLVTAGYDVDTASTATGGCKLVEHHCYDLVLADGKLPDGTGMDVADQAMARGIKSIIITGYALSMPGDNYDIVLKPLTPIELLRIVREALVQ